MSGHMHVKGNVKVTVILHDVSCNTVDGETAFEDLEREADEIVGLGLDAMDVKDYELVFSELDAPTMVITGYDDPPDREDR